MPLKLKKENTQPAATAAKPLRLEALDIKIMDGNSVMRIECPSCRFSADVNLEKVPSKGANTKCPKCSAVFFVTPAEPVKIDARPPVQLQASHPKTYDTENRQGHKEGVTSTVREKVVATVLGIITTFTLFYFLFIRSGSKLLFQIFFWPLLVCKELFLSHPTRDGIPLGEIFALIGGFLGSIAFQTIIIYILILFFKGKLGGR